MNRQIPPSRPRYRHLTAEQERLVMTYIEAHLSDNIAVATLARLCNMSGSCFSRVFKASTGLTLCQWITRIRLQRARTLLADGALSIAEIAHAIGFHDQSHFVRKFKQVNGVSARDWRAQQLAVPE